MGSIATTQGDGGQTGLAGGFASPKPPRSDLPGLLRAAGVPVYRIYTMFPTLASIEAHIRLVGYLSGEDARAEAEIAPEPAPVQGAQR
jgi:hypothetical protein